MVRSMVRPYNHQQGIETFTVLAEEAGVEPTEDAYAPSNGFEARAPHRERYSSEREHAALSAVAKEGVTAAAPPAASASVRSSLRHCRRRAACTARRAPLGRAAPARN